MIINKEINFKIHSTQLFFLLYLSTLKTINANNLYHILFLVKNSKIYFFNKIDHYPEDVWEIKREYLPGKKKNSTKLPEKLVEKLLLYSSQENDLVLDPFMGNGTTAVACIKHKRKYLGFEINPNAKEIIDDNITNALKN